MKRSKLDQLTARDCDVHLTELEAKLKIVKEELGYDFEQKFQEHKKEVLDLKKKLVR